MTTYNTGNPLGSAAAKDLFDNAQNLDFAVNSITQILWADRFGKKRKTLWGMEREFAAQLLSQEQRFNLFIQNSGYQVIGDYADGPLTINEYNQLIRYDGELWKITAATDIPFTTTGVDETSWASDSTHFVSVGDAALRQEVFGNDMLNMSPLYFGAKGDGATDDTAAFATLESQITNRVIDLSGKSFFVTSYPNKNRYVNGKFLLSGQLITAVDDFLKQPTLATNPVVSAHDSSSSLLWYWYLTSTWVRGTDSNAVQSLAFDEKNRFIYAMIESPGTYNGCSILYRLPMDRGQKWSEPLWASDGDRRLGHQGLSVENNRDGFTYLWGTKRNNTGLTSTTDPQAGCKVIRFPIDNVPSYSTASSATNQWPDRNGLYFENVQEYTLWELTNTEQNSQPTISHDQRFLITKMSTNDTHRIRVFSVAELAAGGSGDYSNKYLYEFSVPSSNVDAVSGVTIQGIASDGKHIYFLGGRTYISDGAVSRVFVYTLNGELVTYLTNSELGVADAASESGATLAEDENIGFVTVNGQPTLTILVASGQGGLRSHWVYALNLVNGNFRGNSKNPALMLGSPEGGLDIAAQRTGKLNIGMMDKSGKMTQNICIAASKIALGNGESFDNTLELESVGSNGYADVEVIGNFTGIKRTANAAGFRQVTLKSRNPVQLGSTALVNGDTLYDLMCYGDDGAQSFTAGGGVLAAQASARVTGTVSAGNVPAAWSFYTRNAAGAFALRWDITSEGNFVPSGSGLYNLGNSSNLINNIYAANGTIQTSDENYKTTPEDFTDAEYRVANFCSSLLYKFKYLDAVKDKGDEARYHFGSIAQKVIAAFASEGLEAMSYGVVCFDEWEASEAVYVTKEEILSEDGEVIYPSEVVMVAPAKEAGSRYAIRYDELCIFVSASLQRRLTNLEKSFENMSNRLSELENR